jgi:hypothetical protein
MSSKNESWEDQQKTYAGFMGLLKWSTIGIVAVLLLMYFFLVA